MHLAGSHHGRGRPFYPLINPRRAEQDITAAGGQRFAELTQRYGPWGVMDGPWGLSWMEGALRLADWAASGHPQHPVLHAITAASGLKWPALKPADCAPPTTSVLTLRGLRPTNVAEYCAAVGFLREVSRTHPQATLHWQDDLCPVLTMPGEVTVEDALHVALDNMTALATALDALPTYGKKRPTNAPDDAVGVTSAAITGGTASVPLSVYRAAARAVTGWDAADVSLWVAGWHTELARTASDPSALAAMPGMIWHQGRGTPLGPLGCTVQLAQQRHDTAKSQRAAQAANQRVRNIAEALVTSPRALALQRDESAKTYGLDAASATYKAKISTNPHPDRHLGPREFFRSCSNQVSHELPAINARAIPMLT